MFYHYKLTQRLKTTRTFNLTMYLTWSFYARKKIVMIVWKTQGASSFC